MKFNGFIMALTTTLKPTPLTFEDFSSMIMEEEMRLKVRRNIDEAYVANAKGKDKAKDSGEFFYIKKNMNCFYHGKKGHMVKDCWNMHANAKNDSLQKLESTNIAKTTKVDVFIIMAKSCNMATHNDVWIIDNKASWHMTSHNDWYTSL